LHFSYYISKLGYNYQKALIRLFLACNNSHKAADRYKKRSVMTNQLPGFVMCVCTGKCPGFQAMDIWDFINRVRIEAGKS
jgi:hypothetical protein